MSCEGKIYVGQIGVLLEVDTQGTGVDCPVVDWTDATLLEIRMQLPDKTVVNLPATLSGTKLQHLTDEATDLPQVGTYRIQAHVVGPTYDALGETDKFRVYEPWK